MKKLVSIICLIILAAVLIVAGWFTYKSFAPKSAPEAEPSASETPKKEAAQKAVEQIPELNPIEKTNPFSGSYKNPFKKK